MKTSFLTHSSLLAAIVIIAAACGSRPSPPGPLENVGGASGGMPDNPMAGGTSGVGGVGPLLDAGGDDPEPVDAGSDAAVPDGDAGTDAGPRLDEGCVIDTLDSQCDDGCPELDEAADWLLGEEPAAVVRRVCAGSDGTAYVTIGAGFDVTSKGYIYEAESGALVSKYEASDGADYCVDSSPSATGFYGRIVPDCASVNPNDTTTPCPDGSSGPGNGGDYPDECIYLDD